MDEQIAKECAGVLGKLSAAGMGQLVDQITSHRGAELYDHRIDERCVGLTFGEIA